MSDMDQAARVDDPVEHSTSSLGKVLGFAGGVVVGVLLVATAPVSLTVVGVVGAVGTVAGAASLGGLAGSLGARLFGDSYHAGDVATGAATVFIGDGRGGPLKNAARVEDEVGCHDEMIATGVMFIHIEGKNATRAGEETRCAGKLKENGCCPTVWYGGPSARFMPTRYHGEDSELFFWLDLGAGLVSGRSALKLIPLAATSAPRFHRAYRTVQTAGEWYGYYRGGPVRDVLERTGAVAGALGSDETAHRFNQLATDLSPEGLVVSDPPAPTPTPQEVLASRRNAGSDDTG